MLENVLLHLIVVPENTQKPPPLSKEGVLDCTPHPSIFMELHNVPPVKIDTSSM